MNNLYITDTIAAISTPLGVGAVAIVRMSGPDVTRILDKVFVRKSGHSTNPASHTLYYGTICDGSGQVLDEVMCACMYGPRSYTKEDIVEVYCHGGNATVMAVLSIILKNGARPAEPGEFTKRAFLNGRIDLSQAEAVMELINSKTDIARRAVIRKLSGGLSNKIQDYRNRILTWLAHIELSIDYPEHEEESMNLAMIKQEGYTLLKEIESLCATATLGDRIKAGVPTVIAGRPNVGKSSLMNAILQEDRAIVTDVPGTTRDTLTESVIMRSDITNESRVGVPILLTDTAGIREVNDQVEQIGVERSREHAKSAELVLFVVDGSTPLTKEDYAVAELLKDQRKIIVFNKSDLKCKEEKIEDNKNIVLDTKIFGNIEYTVKVSAKTGAGLNNLYAMVEEMFLKNEVSADGDIITQARHTHLLNEVMANMHKMLNDIRNGMPEDIISISLKAAYGLLGEIIGESVGDDVLDRIFNEFCVGK
ncbi:MAG: tRNA uridine-5-carboxymethylaminomethyl(34) synthesis GTPase MnmE [Defluviitaleaceae bacterium]|nr:tRNA uridine-5-carboxymethylaminomethyl(34) synthesis GTPase MnmE [Defluviitaleaceae bacterium]